MPEITLDLSLSMDVDNELELQTLNDDIYEFED